LANVGFNGIYSDNYATKVLAGETDNTLKFFINNIQRFSITDSANFEALQVDDINFNSNIISTNVSNSDLDLDANGIGKLSIFDLTLDGNTLTNTTAGELAITNTGFGYVKVDGTGGVAFTAGDTVSRRSNPEVGEFRYNTDDSIAEVYDGTDWVAATGPAGDIVSEELMGNIVDEWTLILG